MPIELDDIDTATLSFIAGSSANDLLLKRIRAAGHPHVRAAHGYVFQHLLEDAPTVGELARALDVTQQAVSKTTGELEGLGYVKRCADPADRRVTRLELTRSGRRVVEVARRERAALEEELVQAAGEIDVATTRHVLVLLVDLAGGRTAVRNRALRPPSDQV